MCPYTHFLNYDFNIRIIFFKKKVQCPGSVQIQNNDTLRLEFSLDAFAAAL